VSLSIDRIEPDFWSRCIQGYCICVRPGEEFANELILSRTNSSARNIVMNNAPEIRQKIGGMSFVGKWYYFVYKPVLDICIFTLWYVGHICWIQRWPTYQSDNKYTNNSNWFIYKVVSMCLAWYLSFSLNL